MKICLNALDRRSCYKVSRSHSGSQAPKMGLWQHIQETRESDTSVYTVSHTPVRKGCRMGVTQKVSESLYKITYHFYIRDADAQNEDDLKKSFDVFLDSESMSLHQQVREDVPVWTLLGFEKCKLCPLSQDEYQHCPAARSLVDVVEFFSDLASYTEAELVIETPRRTISGVSSVQEGLRSLMGLIFATSGCPIMANLKPMAYLHLPFSDSNETVYRAVSTYLLGQYLGHQQGKDPDWQLSELETLYANIHQVNLDFMKRLRKASAKDANLNSLVILDLFTMVVPRSLKKQLAQFKPLFDTFWQEPS